MATLTSTVIVMGPASTTGFTLTTSPSSSNGDKYINTGKEIVVFQNSSSQGAGSAITVTVTAQNTDNFGGAASLHNLTISVPSSSFGLTAIGPFPVAVFNDSNSFVNLTYSAAGLNVGVYTVAPRS